jgi:hypothetical protein
MNVVRTVAAVRKNQSGLHASRQAASARTSRADHDKVEAEVCIVTNTTLGTTRVSFRVPRVEFDF